jgi:hypothetical protein
MPRAAVKHVSTALWAPPGFLQWHEVALQWSKCTQCTAQHQQQCVQGTYCGSGWCRCACLDAKTIVDLLFLSEVSHSFLVAAPP